jgi:hypothetical protein
MFGSLRTTLASAASCASGKPVEARFDGHARLALEVFFFGHKQFHNTATDGAATDHSNPKFCAGHSGPPGNAAVPLLGWRLWKILDEVSLTTPDHVKTYRPFATSSMTQALAMFERVRWRAGLKRLR